MTNMHQTTTTQQEPGREQRLFSFRATQLIWLALGLLEALFALRVVLKLVGANAANPFASLLYGVTGAFLAPFAGLTATPAAGGMVLEVSTLVAMLVYALLAWVLERLVWVIFYRPRTGSVNTQTTTTDQRLP
ncbi:MAG: YggT family protein [Anaerolineales bacterium]